MSGRLSCCVPFCRRTTAEHSGFDEWLCGEHWKLIPKPKRRAYGRITKAWRRYHRLADGARGARVWGALRRIAIERAAGL